MVLRLKGTNSDIAKDMISGREKELNISYNEDFDSAAQQVCQVVKKQWVNRYVRGVRERVTSPAEIDYSASWMKPVI